MHSNSSFHWKLFSSFPSKTSLLKCFLTFVSPFINGFFCQCQSPKTRLNKEASTYRITVYHHQMCGPWGSAWSSLLGGLYSVRTGLNIKSSYRKCTPTLSEAYCVRPPGMKTAERNRRQFAGRHNDCHFINGHTMAVSQHEWLLSGSPLPANPDRFSPWYWT